MGDKLHRREGNSPDHRLRPLNGRSVVKKVGVQRQPGGLPRSRSGHPFTNYNDFLPKLLIESLLHPRETSRNHTQKLHEQAQVHDPPAPSWGDPPSVRTRGPNGLTIPTFSFSKFKGDIHANCCRQKPSFNLPPGRSSRV